MNPKAYNLAIETSSRHGSVSLGTGSDVVATIDLGEQRRHAVALMPAIEKLVAAHDATPADLNAIFVSHGPGSFTGLRVGITAAKTLAHVTGASLVAVPTLDVVAANVEGDAHQNLAVLLNAKSGRWFTGLYERRGDRWVRTVEPTLMTADEILAAAPRPLEIVGDHAGETDWPGDTHWVNASLAVPRSEIAYAIGAAMLDAGDTVDSLQLTPHYVRLPDAEEVWQVNTGRRLRSAGLSTRR